jgi:hypothetical protein
MRTPEQESAIEAASARCSARVRALRQADLDAFLRRTQPGGDAAYAAARDACDRGCKSAFDELDAVMAANGGYDEGP